MPDETKILLHDLSLLCLSPQPFVSPIVTCAMKIEMGLSRRPTDPALERARAARRRPTMPHEVSPGRVQERYPAYNFPWEKIEAYLRQKWPNWSNFNPTKARNFIV
jgi:hypothetical protein